MARAGLGLSAADLAELASVRVATVSHFERGGESYASTVGKLREALEKRGAVFLGEGEASLTGGPGVRLRQG